MNIKGFASGAILFIIGIICLGQTPGPLPVPSSLPPSGAAGGDLNGTYPNPTVTNGSHITNASIPNSGLVTPPTAVGIAAVGQIPGTTTNDSAAAGNVGELVVSGAGQMNSINSSGTVTITIASPAVISWTGNPYFNAGSPQGNGCASLVTFSTTGALPTGINANGTANSNYYVTCDSTFTANAFHISTSVANAIAGTAVNTTGTQSGTQTAQNSSLLSNAVLISFGGLLLTPGDWDVTGELLFSPAATTSITVLLGGIVSTPPLNGTDYALYAWRTAAEVPAGNIYAPLNTERISVAAPTTIFCGIGMTFSVNTASAGGFCRARRVR